MISFNTSIIAFRDSSFLCFWIWFCWLALSFQSYMDLCLYLQIRVLFFSIPGGFLGFLSRNCKGISDLYGFILYMFAIDDRSVFKLSRVTWIHVNTCKLGFLSMPWWWFSRFSFKKLQEFHNYMDLSCIPWFSLIGLVPRSWSSFFWEISKKLQRETILIYCFLWIPLVE